MAQIDQVRKFNLYIFGPLAIILEIPKSIDTLFKYPLIFITQRKVDLAVLKRIVANIVQYSGNNGKEIM